MSGFHWALLGAALAALGGGIGSSIGITYVSKIASGILTEDPDKFGPLLPLVAIPGTQGFYGLITAILVVFFFGLITGKGPDLTAAQGLQIFLACLPVVFGTLISAIYQGLTSVGAAGMVAKRSEEAGKALILPALVETYALLSLVVTIILLVSIQRAMGL